MLRISHRSYIFLKSASLPSRYLPYLTFEDGGVACPGCCFGIFCWDCSSILHFSCGSRVACETGVFVYLRQVFTYVHSHFCFGSSSFVLYNVSFVIISRYQAACDFGNHEWVPSFLQGSSCSKVFQSSYAHLLSHFGLVSKGSTWDLGISCYCFFNCSSFALVTAAFVFGMSQ